MATAHSLNPIANRIEKWGQKLTPSNEVFDELAAKAEQLSKSKPEAYKQKLIAWGLIGYAYIFFIFLFFLAIAGSLLLLMFSVHGGYYLFIKLFLILGIPAWAIARSMWLVFPAPDGIEVERKEAPKLFELIDDISEKIGTRVDKVVIDTEFNAAITQVPRLGLFGFHQNYLIIGLPLIQSVDFDHFKAVLAHELGHLSGNHSKSSAWAYSLQARWSQVLSLMRDESPLAYALFYLFFCWYAPRFMAYSMVRVREQEIQADRDAALLTSNETVAEMLAVISVKGRWYSSVVNKFWKRIYDQDKPPQNYHNLIFASLSESPQMREKEKRRASDDPEQWLIEALHEKTKGYDTHPCFKERLAAVGQLDNFTDTASGINRLLKVWSPDKSASQVLLGAKGEEVTSVFNTKFAGDFLEYWQEAHKDAIEEKMQLEDLRAKDAQGEKLTVEELSKLAYMTDRIEGEEAALAYNQRVLELDPDNAQANYYIGVELLLEKNDEKGIEHLRKAMKGKIEVVESACNLIIYYLERSNRNDEIPEFERQLENHYKYVDLALAERRGVTDKDEFEQHDLSDEWIKVWRHWFAQIDEIESVLAVKKKVQYFPDSPYHVVGVVLKGQVDTEVLAYTMLAYMGEDSFCITVFDSFNLNLRMKMELMENSVVYNRLDHMHLAAEETT